MNADIVDANQNTATVVSTLSFGAAGTLLIGSELVTYVKGSPTGTVFNIVRGQFGTTAEMHSSGTSVFEVDQFWTGWGSPHVPQVFSGTALNLVCRHLWRRPYCIKRIKPDPISGTLP